MTGNAALRNDGAVMDPGIQGQRILLLLPNNLGDIIMAGPLLSGIMHEYTAARITYFVDQGFEDPLLENPHIHTLYRFPRLTIKRLLAAGSWREGSALLKETLGTPAAGPFDTVINLSQNAVYSHIVPFVDTKRFIGKTFMPSGLERLYGPWVEYLYAIPFARRYNSLHSTDIYRRIAGVTYHEGTSTVTINDTERREALRYLQGIGIEPDAAPLAVLQPGAAFPSKRWPIESFVAIGTMLEKGGWAVVVTGAPEEKERAAAIAQGVSPSCRSIAGEISFRQTLSVLAWGKRCITGDTALMHGAAGLRVKTVAMFGPTSPVETGPYGDGHYVLAGRCAERPCFKASCESGSCLKTITPDTVWECMGGAAPSGAAPCDVFTTALSPSSDYRLKPVSGGIDGYYDEIGSMMTRLFYNETLDGFTLSQREAQECLADANEFRLHLEDIERCLAGYCATGDKKAIGDYEKKLHALTDARGINAFWSAVLNMRLNCIPLMDVSKGVSDMVHVCSGFREQLAATCLKVQAAVSR